MKIDRIKVVYDEISKYEIKLEADPRSLGPLYLQNTIAECRNYLNAVSRIALEIHREKQDLARALRGNEVAYEVAHADLLSNDERVRRLPSIEDRKAQISAILREELNTIQTLKGQLQDLEFVDKAVRHRHKELTATMTEIKLQRSLIRDEIDSGAMYGDERKGDHERGTSHGPLGSDINEDELDVLLNTERNEGKSPDPPPAMVAAEPEPEPEVSEATAVRAFLDGGPTRTVTESEDFSEVFERLV